MAERKLNLEAPLLSTRRMQKTSAVSVRRNKTFDFTHDFKTNVDSSSSVPDMGLDHFTESASVPFIWEQAPGKLKGYDSTPQEVFTPGPPPGKAIDRNLSSKSKQVDKEEEEESEDAFSDARDTLSPKDTNHSISGVSEYGVVAEKKKTLNPCEDPQSRDFMLNRFLPAAKAMTMEQPHYALNRKPSSCMSEPTLQIRELVPVEKRQTSKRYDESIVLAYCDSQDVDDEESKEEEDVDGEVSEYADLPRRGCGMLPQLCFKESLGMLNTVPGFKAKHKSSPSHDQVKSSKVSQLKSRFQSVKQLALHSVSKQKLSGKVQSPVHPSMGKKVNSETNLTCSASRSSSPYRHPRCMSPFRTASYPSPLHSTCFPDTRKETENLRANRLNKHIRRSISRSQELLYYSKDNGSTSSLSEKTLCVDNENSPKTSDHHKSNVMIFPEGAEKKPDTNLEFENVSSRSGKDLSLLAPPSPKKPSESWLLHNLPSVATQIPSRGYRFNPQKQDLNEYSTSVTKWETIVKTSYMHRDHIRFSEELVAHTSLQ